MSVRSVARFIGRVIAATTVLAFATIVGIQYARVIHRNVALAHTLATVNDDIAMLHTQQQERLARIHRLEDPRGAIPEIHDRLHLVLPNESLIYLKGLAPTPEGTP